MIVFLLLCIATATASSLTDSEFESVYFNLPENASEDVKVSGSLSRIIDSYTSMIIQQAPFPRIAGAENLPEHQEAAKVTARTWRSDVRPALFSVNNAILAFSYQYEAFFSPLFENAKLIHTDNGRENVEILLEELVTEIRKQQTATVIAGQKLLSFFNRMSYHKSIIRGDLREIRLTNVSLQTRLPDIQRRIESVEQEIRDYESRYRDYSPWFKYLPIGRGLYHSERSSRLENVNRKSRERTELLKEMVELSFQTARATVISWEVSNLVFYLEKVINATENLQTAWSQLENDYHLVINATTSIDVSTPSGMRSASRLKVLLPPILSAAKKKWKSLVETAQTIKRSHLTPERR